MGKSESKWEAGVRVVILNLKENTEVKYVWGLGITTNNQAETFSLRKGLKISLDIGIKTLYIVDDSLIIIQKCIKLLENIILLEEETSSIIVRITYLLIFFEKVHLFHTLHVNYHLA